MRKKWGLSATFLPLALLVWVAWEEARPVASIAELAMAIGERRLIEPRLTGGFAYAPCERLEEPRRVIPQVRCSAPPEPGSSEYRALSRMISELKARVGRGGDIADLRAVATLQ